MTDRPERRAAARFKSSTDVKVKLADGKSKLCRAVNLSGIGVGIYTEDMSLKLNQKVELMFIIRLGKITKLHKRLARVCHVSNGVTGFSMHPYEPVGAAS